MRMTISHKKLMFEIFFFVINCFDFCEFSAKNLNDSNVCKVSERCLVVFLSGNLFYLSINFAPCFSLAEQRVTSTGTFFRKILF